MENISIRLTRRTELAGRAVEQTIDIDLGAANDSHAKPCEAHPTTAAASLPTPALEWSTTLCNGERVKHAAAEKACAELGEGWRLPTRVELLSLVDDTRSDPAIDTERFPDTKSGAYWTSTPFASDSSFAWIVHFGSGLASTSSTATTTTPSCVRCVRPRPVSSSAF